MKEELRIINEIATKIRTSELGWSVRADYQCRFDKSKKRTDLIINHQSFGEYGPIGVECKYIDGSARGESIAQALKQIKEYRKLNHRGKRIPLWAIGFYHRLPINEYERISQERTMVFAKAFLNAVGIGFFDLNDRHLRIHFGQSDSELIVNICDSHKSWNFELEHDMVKIHHFTDRMSAGFWTNQKKEENEDVGRQDNTGNNAARG
jgi:hypothetical protein